MNDKERAAMQQAQIAISDAVNALLFLARDCEMRNSAIDIGNAAITAMREALAEQAEQEPVAWGMTNETGEVLDCISHKYKITQPCTVDFDLPLYAAPARTKDLTDDEIDSIDCEYELDDYGLRDFARAVIAADREKNRA